MIALTANCYIAEDKQQNDLNCKRYMIILQGYLDKAQNTGFTIHDQGIVTYSQNNLV